MLSIALPNEQLKKNTILVINVCVRYVLNMYKIIKLKTVLLNIIYIHTRIFSTYTTRQTDS